MGPQAGAGQVAYVERVRAQPEGMLGVQDLLQEPHEDRRSHVEAATSFHLLALWVRVPSAFCMKKLPRLKAF